MADIHTIPRAYDEPSAARLLTGLGYETSTRKLKSLRDAGKIGYVQFGGRIKYREDQIAEYIERQSVNATWHDESETTPENGSSAGTGSGGSQGQPASTSAGGTPELSADSAEALVRQTRKKPKSGSSPTS